MIITRGVDLQRLPMPGTHHPDFGDSLASWVRDMLDTNPLPATVVHATTTEGAGEPQLLTVRKYFAPAPYVGAEAVYVWRVAEGTDGRYIAGSQAVFTVLDPISAYLQGL